VPGYQEKQSVTQKSKVLLPFVLGALCVGMANAFPFGPPNGFTPALGDKPGVAGTQCHTDKSLNGGGGRVQVVFPLD
jgi:hypothetical protein